MAPKLDEWVAFTTVERAMARRMERAAVVPLASEFTYADVSAALDEVERLQAQGVPATFTALIVAAVAHGLVRFPEVAAKVDYSRWMRRLPTVAGIGVAVAADRGLVVPVLHDAARMSLSELAHELDELVRAARTGDTDPSLFRGSDFTVTNIGNLPVYGGVPVPNVPEIAILSVGRWRDVPVVADGAVRASKVVQLTLGLDHRALDGITAGRFLAALKEVVEDASCLAAPAL